MSLAIEPMQLESTVNMPDIGDVELSLSRAEDTILRMSMPNGIAERLESDDGATEEDKQWLTACLTSATNLSPAEIETMETSKVHYFVISAIRLLCRQEMISYYEYLDEVSETEETSLMEQGSWQVQND